MSILLRSLRFLLVTLVAFLAVTAIPGGLALLVGRYSPPLSTLQGSPFSDFTIPALTLIVIVGGTAAFATLLLARRNRSGLISAGIAGAVVMSFEFVQVLVIGSPAGPPHVMQVFYFFLGLVLVATSLALLHLKA